MSCRVIRRDRVEEVQVVGHEGLSNVCDVGRECEEEDIQTDFVLMLDEVSIGRNQELFILLQAADAG